MALFFAIGFLLAVPLSANAQSISQRAGSHAHPRTANYYLYSPISTSDISGLAQFDILILSPQTEENSKSALKELKRRNPDIILLVYIPSQEVPLTYYKQWESNPNGVWHQLIGGITNDMWLYDQNGQPVTFWAQNWMLNPNTAWADYVSSFIQSNFFGPGDVWDGVFYDNVWTDISWINNGNIDLNRDGSKDSVNYIRTHWEAGMRSLFTKTRQKIGNDVILIGNGDRGYPDLLNGIYFENFSKDIANKWGEKMELYKTVARGHKYPRTPIIGNNTGNTGNYKDYRNVRFGLTSSLLESGYYAFDFGDQGHENIWWYDEYNVDLGTPSGNASSRKGFSSYQPDVWRRDFSNGVSIVNSTKIPKTVELGGEFEKLHGSQDPSVNDGSIVNEVSIDGMDGLILLKTFEGLQDVLFTNGEFARFFRPNGERVRNGFFVFDERYKGGAQIALIDLDNNGKRELLLIDRTKMMAWRDDGVLYMKVYPYTANYKGKIRAAVGDLNEDGKLEVYVGPSGGHALPIKVYTRHGRQMKRDWYPFGTDYTGGYTFAIRDVKGRRNNELIIGTGEGHDPIVHVFTRHYEFKTAWNPFALNVRGGVNVATGDLDGDGTDEIITGPGPGSKPVIRTWRGDGTAYAPEFRAYTSFGNPGIDVRTLDVDFDGKDDIVGMSSGF